MRLLLILTILTVTFLSVGTIGQTASSRMLEHGKLAKKTCPHVVRSISVYRERTWTLQKVMGERLAPTRQHEQRARSCKYVWWVMKLWQRRMTEANVRFENPPHKLQWLCIHRYEGSWTDPNSPYYGGLQMDDDFQETYGHTLYHEKGTADHWTPLEQMWVAERAYKTRGFWPWPNTARYCGLI